jgi:hypothetical protein
MGENKTILAFDSEAGSTGEPPRISNKMQMLNVEM